MAPSPDETEARPPNILEHLGGSTSEEDEAEARAQMPSVPVEVKSPHKNWSIKDGQEVVDKHTGLHLRFGSYGDGSGSVFLIATLAGPDAPGVTIVFQREGEPTRLLPHVVGKGAAEALDENVEKGDSAPQSFVENTGADDGTPAETPKKQKPAFTPIS